MILDAQYRYLNTTPGLPVILKEAMKLYGTKEVAGAGSNPIIKDWAKEIGGWIADWYKDDDIPWCGLFVGICAKRAGFPHNQKLLAAREWLNWGWEPPYPSLGDVLVFERSGGGHVGFYVGEDFNCFHVLGGNQSNEVNVMRIRKERLLGARRCKWRIKEPVGVARKFLKPVGDISLEEA